MSALSPLKRYRVTIAEWVHYSIEVQASSDAEAEAKAQTLYKSEVFGEGPVSFEKDAGPDGSFVEEIDED